MAETRFVSALLRIPLLRRFLLRLRVLPANKWPEPAFEYFNLPLAVFLKRLAAALTVFFFGMRCLTSQFPVPSWGPSSERKCFRMRMSLGHNDIHHNMRGAQSTPLRGLSQHERR